MQSKSVFGVTALLLVLAGNTVYASSGTLPYHPRNFETDHAGGPFGIESRATWNYAWSANDRKNLVIGSQCNGMCYWSAAGIHWIPQGAQLGEVKSIGLSESRVRENEAIASVQFRVWKELRRDHPAQPGAIDAPTQRQKSQVVSPGSCGVAWGGYRYPKILLAVATIALIGAGIRHRVRISS